MSGSRAAAPLLLLLLQVDEESRQAVLDLKSQGR
jgi:hypothetical protein